MAVLPTGIGPVTGGYQIERSLRFNSADSAYLNRTPASSPTSNQKFTLSCWFKRTATGGTYPTIYSANDAQVGGGYPVIAFASDAIYLQLDVGGTTKYWQTTQVFRDLSAWYHIVWAVDTTQATATDRMKLYINGSLVTSYSTQEVVTQNGTSSINGTTTQQIGSFVDYGRHLNGYLAEFYMVDGQQLAASSFGETDAATGVWKAKKYAGTYGTNGFYLNFADNSGTTSTTLGKDSSGNGNNWTPNSFSVTAGAGNDSLVDSPTAYGTDTGVGGSVRGNYATLNPIAVSSQGQATLTNGNLDISGTTNSYTGAVSTFGLSSGKWYWEYIFSVVNSTSGAGIINSASLRSANGATYGFAAASDCWFRASGGEVYNNSVTVVSSLSTFSANDVMNIAVDFDAGKLWFGKNGTWDSSGNPATGANATITFTPGGKSFNACVQGYANSGSWSGVNNFGQRAFAYTAPSGFKALCTTNLPTPTIGATSTTQANDYFDVTLYTGTDATQTITNSGSMQPDLVWVKSRNSAYNHYLYDSIRGATNALRSSTTGVESQAGDSTLTTTTNGFTVTGTGLGVNSNGTTIVGWQWNAGGSNATNTSGTITSTVRANTTSGFSIVTWTNPGSNQNITVGHGLGVAPSMIIVKQRNTATSSWPVWHIGLTGGASNSTYRVYLDLTSAQAAATNVWGSAAPTSSVFGVGVGVQCDAGATMVAYCFAPVAGYSDFGSYTGNGSTDGPFVYLGFRARWILIKSTGASEEQWMLYDTARNTYNVSNTFLMPSASNAELTTRTIDINSNGFKVRDTDTKLNTNAEKYIYAAFAETPFRYSLAR